MMKTYQNHAMTDAEARQALADACKQVETNLPLYTYQCQNHSSVNNIYPGCANNQWTCGFWPGEIWLAYEATGDEKFKTAALIQVDSFADRIARKVEVDHHDMGFLYSPTCVAAWKLVGSEKGKNAAIAAASDSLGSVSLTGYEIVKLVKASRACSEMALSAFESYIVEVIAEAVARRIEKYIFTGTGTNQPGGVKTAGKGASGAYTDGTDQITVGKTASLTEENVIALYGLLGDGYERNAVWCMNKATFFSDFFPLMNKSKNNVIEFANGKYYIMGAEVYFTGSLAAHEAYIGDFSYIIGNYSQDITVVRSEHSGLATNSIDYLGACVFDSKPVAGFGAFVHLAKAAA